MRIDMIVTIKTANKAKSNPINASFAKLNSFGSSSVYPNIFNRFLMVGSLRYLPTCTIGINKNIYSRSDNKDKKSGFDAKSNTRLQFAVVNKINAIISSDDKSMAISATIGIINEGNNPHNVPRDSNDVF